MLLKPNLKGLSLLFPQGLWFTRVTTRDHYLIVTPAPSGGDCRVAPANQLLFCYKTAYLLTDTVSFKWCTSVSQPFIGLSCSSFMRLVPTPHPDLGQKSGDSASVEDLTTQLQHIRNKYHPGFCTYSGMGVLFWIITLLLGEQQCCFLENCWNLLNYSVQNITFRPLSLRQKAS